MSNLYDKIGGSEAVDSAVEIFYRKVLMDKRISHFFSVVDMDQQIAKQKGFLTYAFGGPHKYDGKSMSEGHAHLLKMGLNDSHVDVVIELLANTLKELKVPDNLIQEVGATAESVRDQVLGKA